MSKCDPSSPKRPSHVDGEIGKLANAVERLETISKDHIRSLDSVVRAVGDGDECDKIKDEVLVPLASTIRDLRNRVEIVCMNLESTHAALEL